MQNDNKIKKHLVFYIDTKNTSQYIMDEYKKNIEITFTIEFSYGLYIKRYLPTGLI